jgi:hypothetical protein
MGKENPSPMRLEQLDFHIQRKEAELYLLLHLKLTQSTPNT